MKVNEMNFAQEVLHSGKPVLVEFEAPWCGYCRRLAPAMERLAAEHSDALTLAHVDIDDSPRLASQYNIEVIPTLTVFRGGKALASVVNPGSQEAAEQWLREQGVL